jgi:hypothetical protein
MSSRPRSTFDGLANRADMMDARSELRERVEGRITKHQHRAQSFQESRIARFLGRAHQFFHQRIDQLIETRVHRMEQHAGRNSASAAGAQD